MVETIGRYEILDELGRGGFAIVHRARDTQLGREVALKELRPVLLNDTAWVQRFEREAQAIARLDHPRIVPIYDICHDKDRLCLIMRLVNGPALDDLIASRACIPWTETVNIISAIAEGLDYAHRQGILHRDLKPANILIDMDRGPMLTDFGLAKLIEDNSASLSASGSIVGTPHYIAPEVWEGKGSTPPSDIYALGCLLFEMLTGEKVFKGTTPPVIMMAHFQPVVLPQVWPEGVPAGVAGVLHQAIALKPADRFQTAGQMAAALKQLPADGVSRVTVQSSDSPHPATTVPPVPPPALEQAKTRLNTEASLPEDEADPDDFNDTDLESAEEEVAKARRGLPAHLKSYAVIVGMLAMINLVTGGGYPWFLWVALAWGMGLLFHLRSAVFGKMLASPGKWAKFFNHFSSYAIVIGTLFGMNILTGGGDWWVMWPAMGWGIGLIFHFLSAIGGGNRDEQSEFVRGMRQQRHDWRKQVRREKKAWKKQFTPSSPPPTQTRTATAPAKPATPPMEAGLQEHLTKARAYRQQIDNLGRTTANPQIRTNLNAIGQQVDEWMKAIEDLAERINNFQQNSLIQHDLKTVPAAIKKLEARLSTETDPGTHAELERALTNRQKQWLTLQHLHSTMQRAEIKIENTLSLLGTLYPQILTSQSTNQVSDYSRITSEVSEEVRVLHDHLEALEEVKLGQATSLR
jgi:serine/threonine protein kinase/predicted  nucleic acid-binding Zn-ribbon protein